MTNTRGKRDLVIDLLRALGTVLIMLDHVFPPNSVKTFCLFDVPLLVFLSGMSTVYSAPRLSNWGDYGRYLVKRIKRLVFPTWITVTVVVLLNFVLNALSFIPERYSVSEILRSYLLLQQSIGYVWIVRVYLLIALANPLYTLFNEKIESDIVYFLCHTLILGCFFGVCFLLGNVPNILKSTICYLIPYGFVLAIGLRIGKKKRLSCFMAMFAAVFLGLILLSSGADDILENTKYPPMLSFVLHGILWSCIFLELGRLCAKRLNEKTNIVIEWISRNSFELYLVHVLLICLMKWFSVEISWYVGLPLVFALSSAITWWLRVCGNRFRKNHLNHLEAI